MKDKDGGPAFPMPASMQSPPFKPDVYVDAQQGMSLRDWFAGQALVGVFGLFATATKVPVTPERVAAEAAYMLADAMLKARETPSSSEGAEPKQQQTPTHAENHPVVP